MITSGGVTIAAKTKIPTTAYFLDFANVSEETKLVVKILQLAGVGIKDYTLAQAATQKEISKIQQEKQ